MMRVVPLAVDLASVMMFAALTRLLFGRDILGILSTAWPFLLACLAAWIVVAALGDQGYGFRAAAISWLVTWMGGVAIRLLFGPFAGPACMFTVGLLSGILFFGWRYAYHLFGWGRITT